jgi:hypothetical protein
VTQSFAQTLHELNMDVLLFSRESTVPEKGKEPENSSITIHYVVRMYSLASERRALSPKWPATHPFKASRTFSQLLEKALYVEGRGSIPWPFKWEKKERRKMLPTIQFAKQVPTFSLFITIQL